MATVSTDNTIKSWIEQRRNVLSHAAKGPWRTGGWGALLSADNEQLLAGTATSEGYVQDEADERAIIDSHNTLPRALNALEAVLEVLDAGVRDGDSAEVIRRVAMIEIEGAINHE